YSIVNIKLESPPLMDISYDMRRDYDKEMWLIEFRKIAGKIKHIEGSWQLELVDKDYTKVTYYNDIDIGLPVPGFILDSFKKNGLYKLADHIQKRVESNGTWKK